MVPLLMLLASYSLIIKTQSELALLSPFECGFLNNERGRSVFSLHFFLVALLFLVFDVELVLIFPLFHNSAAGANELEILVSFVFLTAVTLGLCIEWVNSILEWSIFRQSF